jgi:alpha-amylase
MDFMPIRDRRSQWLMLFAGLSLTPAASVCGQADSLVMLQIFETPWSVLEHRAVDIWAIGYEELWVPPPGQAEFAGGSVGYDVYDRFDLGSADAPTRYGTAAYVHAMNDLFEQAGLFVYADTIINHNAFADKFTPGFAESGGYPGFVLEWDGYLYGDFHDYWAGDVLEERVAGLIDIAQESNIQLIRNPVDPDDPNNIPPGVTPWNGRLANLPDPANAALYPDTDLPGETFTNPATGNTFTRHPFNLSEPLAGDPRLENGTGLLLRYGQWMTEVAGFDGYRIDAAKHVPAWFFDSFWDDAVHRTGRIALNGERVTPFSFGEVLDGSHSVLMNYVRKNGYSNRDVLDFGLFFPLRDNLTLANGANSWNDIIGRSVDVADDGFMNGSVGVKFVHSHDNRGASLDNVAFAYTLLMPGRSIVYMHGEQYGPAGDFPQPGRGDALGGAFGETLTTLVGIARSHGRGYYYPRWQDQFTFVFERQNALLVGLSSNNNSGFDTVTVDTDFTPGTKLIDLTGHATDSTFDPGDDLPDVLTVGGDRKVTITVPRNSTGGITHRSGYVAYGPATPQGELTIVGASDVIPPEETPADPSIYDVVRTRLSAIDVVDADQFTIRLQTNPVTLPAGHGVDDAAGGDGAIFRINNGIDVTGGGFIDTDPANRIAYAFQDFVTKASPLYGGGDGEFLQIVNTDDLPEGLNFITVRAFRHRDAGPALFTDFNRAIYVDRMGPETDLAIPPITYEGVSLLTLPFFDFAVSNDDGTADAVHVLFNVDPGDDVLDLIDASNELNRVDRTEFERRLFGLPHGPLEVDVIALEISGSYGRSTYDWVVNLQRPGDMDESGFLSDDDICPFYAQLGLTDGDPGFNSKADIDIDGDVDDIDAGLFRLLAQDAGLSLLAADITNDGRVDLSDLGLLLASFELQAGDPGFDARADLNDDGTVDLSDLGSLLAEFGQGCP